MSIRQSAYPFNLQYISHYFFILLSILFLSACNTTVSTLKTDADAISETDLTSGYLLIGVETNFNLKEINIDGPTDINLSHKDLRAGNNFILVPLPAGTFEVTGINMTHYSHFEMREEDDWSFEIKPQTISYVGHLEFDWRGFNRSYAHIELVNRSTEALEFMQKDFPNILSSRMLYYGGPGEDSFFDFLETLGK